MLSQRFLQAYQTAGFKTRRNLAQWFADLVALGVRGKECRGVPDFVLEAIEEEVKKNIETSRKRSEAGRRGMQSRWGSNSGSGDNKPDNKTDNKPITNGITNRITKKKEEENGKEERTKEEKDREEARNRERKTVHAGAREEPREDASRLGFTTFAPVEAELRKLIPQGIPLASVYAAADRLGFGPEELLVFANHYAGYGWRRGQGQGSTITGNTIGNVLAVWASRRGNFAKGRTVAARQDSDAGEAAAEKKPTGKPVEVWRFDNNAFKEDRGAFIWGLPDEALPYFALWLCREENNQAAAVRYRKHIEKHGAAGFRRELDKFAGALAAGEEPENRGSAFMAAVKKLEEA